MSRVLRWLGILSGSAAALVLIAVGVVYARASHRVNATYDVPTGNLVIPTDSVSMARGHHLVLILGCAECHGADLGGQSLIDAPFFATISAPNLTRGEGGIGATYADLELIRSIREGVQADGKSV